MAIFNCQCSKAPVEEVSPEILDPGSSQVTIAWVSREPYRGKVFYKPGGVDSPPLSALEPPGESRYHEVTITGLLPGSRYLYWPENNPKHYRFQTQPQANTPFSFMMIYGDMSKQAASLRETEVFDFFLSLDPPAPAAAEPRPDPFAAVRPFIPVFNLNGVDSAAARTGTTPGLPRQRPPLDDWSLDWAGFRLIFLKNPGKLPSLLDSPSSHTFGVITYPEVAMAFRPDRSGQPDPSKGTEPAGEKNASPTDELHSILVAHNQSNPIRPASFVIVVGGASGTVELDDIQYLGVPGVPVGNTTLADNASTNGGALRIDVDVESIRALSLENKKEITLRKPPLKRKRTCEECRRLADKGAYEESIKAYTEFIASHRDHFQIDDAYFAIAEIYDEKLFLFPNAMEWYQRLVTGYPSGTLTPLALQRIKYLTQYSDYDYIPLQRFDRIRKSDFSRETGKPQDAISLLRKVEEIIRDYPDCKLAPAMQYWLANRFRQFSVPEAVNAYNTLKEKYPLSPEAKTVLQEIGDTYYQAGLNREAAKIYQKALLELPDQEKNLRAQLNRVYRNIRRDHLSVIGWIVTAILLALAFLVKPWGVDGRLLRSCILAFIILGVLLAFGAWLIHEQFTTPKEAVLLVILLAFNAAFSSFLSIHFANKITAPLRKKGTPAKGLTFLTGVLYGMVFFTTGLYMIIYYVNSHYLVLAKL